MIRTESLLVMGILCFWISAAFGVTNEPESQERNYRLIVDRNPFGLKPPPPPPTNAPPPVTAKDEILLTGMTSIGGLKAYFMTKPPQGKNPEYYTLSVDEKRDALEVLEINIGEKSVRVRNAGVESLMTFASNGVKAPAVAAAAPGGGPLPPGAGPGMGAPVAATTLTPPPMTSPPGTIASNSRVRTIPSRNVRSPAAMGGMNPGMTAAQPAAPPNPYAAETDVLLMELQRKANPNVSFPPTPAPMPP